jgi:hypothetical protein
MFFGFSRPVRAHQSPGPRRLKFSRLRVEQLEDRCVPAFTTAFNAGTGALTITGTAAADGIDIVESGPAGAYGIAELDGVTGAVYFTGVKSISVDTQGTPAGADDTVNCIGSATAYSVLSGAFNMTCSGGLILQFGDYWNLGGAVNINSTTTTGNLNVQTRSGQFARASNMTLGPTTITHGGSGFTQLVLVSDLAANNTVAINGSLTLNMSPGNNILALNGISIAGGLTEIGNGPSASISIFGTSIGGFVSLNGKAPNAGITAQVAGCKIGTFFSVSSGNGNDTITVDNTSVLGLGLTPQQQTFGVDLKEGTNTSKIGTTTPRANNIIHGSLFHYGAGTETFELRNYLITSFVTVNAQAGSQGIGANISASRISNFLSFASAGNADDVVIVDGISIGQNFALDLGGGGNTTIIANNTYLGSYSQVDQGNDTIAFSNNTGYGDVRLSGNSLTIDPMSFQNDRIAGNATFTSTGNGTKDAITLGVTLGSVADGTNAVAIGKTLTINVGSGSGDGVTLNNVTVKGDVVVTATANAAETFTLTNTFVGGNLTLNGGNSTDALTIYLGPTPSSNTGPLTVLGNTIVTGGAGNDLVYLTDVILFGTTTINTNGGADTVKLETNNGMAGPSEFHGAVNVGLGNDNDALFVGGSGVSGLNRSGNPARFFSTILFDGGAGTDSATAAFVQYFGGEPTVLNF